MGKFVKPEPIDVLGNMLTAAAHRAEQSQKFGSMMGNKTPSQTFSIDFFAAYRHIFSQKEKKITKTKASRAVKVYKCKRRASARANKRNRERESAVLGTSKVLWGVVNAS